jgi:CHAT domain-containing protein/Tfp pilus assembly protein PilF
MVLSCRKRSLVILLAALALASWFIQPSAAQSGELDELNERVTALYQAGKFAEAIPLAQRLVAISEKALGPDNPRVAIPLTKLALLYHHQARYADAEPLYKRVLAIYEKTLGPDHPLVSLPLNNLAGLYDSQGRYADAEALFKRALALQEKALGPDHPAIALSLDNLAELYHEQGRYADAEPLYKRSLALREKALGAHHPDVAQVLNNLAALYHDQGRYADAELLYERSLAILENALGPNHPNVARVVGSMAQLYRFQGRDDVAEPLYKRALSIDETVLGAAHPDVAIDLNNLAGLYKHQGRTADAELLYKRSLSILENALGPDHPNVATALVNLAELLRLEGRDDTAAPLYKRALSIYEKAFGAVHPEVATTLNDLALLHYSQGRYADAEPLLKRSLAIREKTLGPDHPDVATSLNNLAILYAHQIRGAEAEPLYKRALAIYEKALGPDHPSVALALNNLAIFYGDQGRYADALPLVRRTISDRTAAAWAALPVLFGAQFHQLISADEAFDDGLDVVQRATQTSVAQALNTLTVRFSAGSDRLAQLARRDQDLADEAESLDKAIITAVSTAPSKRDGAAEQRIRDRIAAISKERSSLQNVLASEFPAYAALSRPEPLTVKDIQPLLADDEAIVLVDLGAKSYVWAITRSKTDWKELAVTADQVSQMVSRLRVQLDFHSDQPFDPTLSFDLYRQVLGPVESLIRSKLRLSLVVDGALTSLPPQVLVTEDPAGKEMREIAWFVRRHAITVLPSLASLKVLRGKSATASAEKPLIGLADPVFDRHPNARVAANVTAAQGIRGIVADIDELRTALAPLPDTADELGQVAASVKAAKSDIILGLDATETRVKQTKLDQYRIVYFATHALVAGQVADFAKLNAEPALVLTLPDQPTEFDDGLLTASEVAQLRLNADWVVLSACNTAAGDRPGAEALSGLARAFFYAGGRSLLVSHWAVDTQSTVALMVGTFAAIADDPTLSHGQALQKSMLAMIDNTQNPTWADPKFWAPFVVVGEPAKPAN